MRAIKFRAWVPPFTKDQTHQMIEGVQPLMESLVDGEKPFCMMPHDLISFHEPTGRKRYWWEVEVDAIMQFTGLKDKNGKEIYEGDILMETIMYDDTPTKDTEFEIKFIGGAFIFPGYPNSRRIIIGNIYQNPDLLK